MVRVMKSPNMMSTTGRMPVMAAPTPRPVKPASEMGVSTTRSLPNSSTRPESTLKGVPASATSSPMMNTRGSRRISSARASRTAWAKVSSRPFSGIDVLLHFFRAGIGSSDGELHCRLHVLFYLSLNALEIGGFGQSLLSKPPGEQLQRIVLRLPALLFFLRAVVLAVDVAHVMAAVAIGVADQKRRAVTSPGALDQVGSQAVNGAHVLPIHALGVNAESGGAAHDFARRSLGIMGVFVVQVVFADVDDGQLPELRQVHHFV